METYEQILAHISKQLPVNCTLQNLHTLRRLFTMYEQLLQQLPDHFEPKHVQLQRSNLIHADIEAAFIDACSSKGARTPFKEAVKGFEIEIQSLIVSLQTASIQQAAEIITG